MSRPRDERAGTGQPVRVIANEEVYYSDRDHAMIRRSPRPLDQFTVIRNDVLRDSRLSFRARGLLASILSRPDNWTARVSQLVNEGTEGREAIRSALDELKDRGYLKITQYRNKEGQFVTDQVVYDVPQTDDGQPLTGNPSPDVRDTDSWEVLEELSRTTKKKEREEQTIKNPPATKVADIHFDAFWDLYPKKVKKKVARRAFDRALKAGSFEDIMAGLHEYVEKVCGVHPDFIAHPTSWLNGERWNDEPDPQFTPVKTGRDATVDRVKQASLALERERSLELNP